MSHKSDTGPSCVTPNYNITLNLVMTLILQFFIEAIFFQSVDLYLRKSTKGAIYFSLGSILHSSDIGDQIRLFLEAVKQLNDYNFIGTIGVPVHMHSNLPSNLLISEWLPQNRILGMKL